MSKIWALSDTHGHYTELIQLYARMLEYGFEPDQDILVACGDYGKLTAVTLDPANPQAEPVFTFQLAVAAAWDAFPGFAR